MRGGFFIEPFSGHGHYGGLKSAFGVMELPLVETALVVGAASTLMNVVRNEEIREENREMRRELRNANLPTPGQGGPSFSGM